MSCRKWALHLPTNPTASKLNPAEVSVSERANSLCSWLLKYRRGKTRWRPGNLLVAVLLREGDMTTWDRNSRGAENDGGAEDKTESCHDTGSGSGGWQEHWATDRLSGCAWASDEYTLQTSLGAAEMWILLPLHEESTGSCIFPFFKEGNCDKQGDSLWKHTERCRIPPQLQLGHCRFQTFTFVQQKRRHSNPSVTIFWFVTLPLLYCWSKCLNFKFHSFFITFYK